MQDIHTQDDVRALVDTFYATVRQDDTIGHIFNKLVGNDWSQHLPKMYSFWSTVLLHQQGYSGNPVAKHIEVDKKIPLEGPHYKRWMELWTATVDSLFAGEVAEEAKKRAGLMAQLIELKVGWAREGKSLA